MKTHYETLGIKTSAEITDIKKAYFELAKKYHPDSGDESEVKKFYEISEAYKVLTDKELKKAYDQTLAEGLEKISALEAETATKKPPNPTPNTQKRDTYRDVELKEFHRNRFRKAIFRVAASTLLTLFLGTVAALILGGEWYLGTLAGALIGFSSALRQNFDLSTFFATPQRQRSLNFFLWGIFVIGILYFVLIAFL